MHRRQFLKTLGAGAAALLLNGCLESGVSAGDSARQKNVLFICLDDLNDWVGCIGGHPDTQTPNIDALGRRGIVFANAYCSSPLCGPSRAAFLSGMRASTTGMYDNLSKFSDHEELVSHTNLPQLFRQSGYAAYGAGKIFHHDYPGYWDEFLPRGPRLYNAGEPKRNGTNIPGIFDWGPLDRSDEDMDDYRMAQFAVDRLGMRHARPFFLGCGIYLPHAPWYAPRNYFDKFPMDSITMPVIKPDDLEDIPPVGRSISNPKYTQAVEETGKQREAVQAYLACINFVDTQVGRILDALERSPARDNTIVVLFGDHGLHLGEKQKWHKDSLWAEAARAPLIIYAPGMRGNGLVCERPVSLIDLYPTLAELCGFQAPGNLEGHSLVKLLRDPSAEWEYPAITNRRKDQTSVRTQHWSYIRYQDGSEELYDIQADPYEWINLAGRGEYDAIKAELLAYVPKNQK